MDGANTVVCRPLAATAAAALALLRMNRASDWALAPRAEKNTNREAPARSAARTRRTVASPFRASSEPDGWSRMDAPRWTTVCTPRSAWRNVPGSARSPRASWTRTRSGPRRRGSRTRQRTGSDPASVNRRSTARPTVPVAPVSRITRRRD